MKNKEIKIGGHKKAKPQNIVLFEGDQNYSHIYFKNGSRLTVATTLGILEERFSEHNFYRSHKKYLVNVNEVLSCIEFTVLMKNKKHTIVSRRRKEGLISQINSLPK